MSDVIKKMKLRLMGELEEWLGNDIPEEGAEDYDTWQFREAEIEAIVTFADVYSYFGENDERADEFFKDFGIENFKTVL